MRQQLEESQRQLQAQEQGSGDERSRLEARVKELQAKEAAEEARMKSLAPDGSARRLASLMSSDLCICSMG